MTWKNTIDPLNDEIIHTENPNLRIAVSDFLMREPSEPIRHSLNSNEVYLEMTHMKRGQQEVENENLDNNFDCNQETEQAKYITASVSTEASISGKDPQQQQENEENLPVAMSSVKSSLPDLYDSIKAESKNTVTMDKDQEQQNQILNQQLNTSEPLIIAVEDIKPRSNLPNLPTLMKVQGMSKIRTNQSE
jgi:hypothetical protein